MRYDPSFPGSVSLSLSASFLEVQSLGKFDFLMQG
jgi:hypothetical protein